MMDDQSEATQPLSSTSQKMSKSLNPMSDSKGLIGQESNFFRYFYLSVKWMFIGINGMFLFLFLGALLGISIRINWEPENALVILGIMFGIVLCFVALFGAIKEECYIVLTFNLFVSVIYIASVYYQWRSLPEEIFLFFCVVLCFLFAHLIYRKYPVPKV